MAANPWLACDASEPNTCEVTQMFSDIPFISVGILVLGVFVLFLVLKRVPLSAIFLFFSALLAFVAAVLDSSQILAHSSAINATLISNGVIRAREVLLALSIGFRFLFYWSYVAEPSRRALSAATTQGVWKIDFPIFEPTQKPHCGSWVRWRLPRQLAAAGLFVAIVVITALQIVWRVVPQFRQYSNVYATDAALALLVSFLILLRLLSNAIILGSVDSMLTHTFSEYVLPIFGLLFNMAIGVGDLLRFAFTESTVGRLLQALEVFIIVVSVMVTAFIRHRDIFLSPISSQDINHGGAVFTLPEPVRGSTFRITPPLIETPRMSTVLGIATQTKDARREYLHPSVSCSLSRVSSWLSFRIPRRHSHPDDDEVKLWNAEKAKGRSTNAGEMDVTLRKTSTQASKEWPGRGYDASSDHITTISALRARSAIAKFMECSSRDSQTLHASQPGIPQRTISLARSSPLSLPTHAAKQAENVIISPEASPVYGLSGVQSLASDCGSRTSLDDLLRQQSELDKSIEALRSLTAEMSNAVPNNRSAQLTRSPSTGQKTVCSEVSLSNFPVPPGPTVPIPPLPTTRSSPIQRIRGDRRVLLATARGQDAHTLSPPTTLALLAGTPNPSRVNSIPHTPTGEENECLSAESEKSSHTNFGGMQYNVTSFIGDLATPGGPRQSQDKPCWPRDDFGSRPASLPRQPNELLVKPSHSSGLSRGNVIDGHANVMHQRTHPLTIPQISVTDSTENDKSKSLANTISQPVQDSRPKDGDEKMFVRRRPPRLAIQSYNPCISGVEPVQVLDDSLE